MSRLAEATVQVHAQEFLEKRFKRKARKGKLFSQLEVRTKRKYGGKRADGVLAFTHWLLGTYVISMEAKSFKTLPAIVPKLDAKILFWNSLKAGVLISILTGAFFAIYKMEDGLMQFLLPLNTLAVGAILYGMVTWNHFTHKTVSVIKQIGQYPANEQWLAFSQDSLNAIPMNKVENLKTICKHRGIGVLIVKPKGKVEIFVKAKFKMKWLGDFLKYYSVEEEILKQI